MARDFGRVNIAIWADPEWRKLPPAAQHLYLLLWTSPALNYCGVHDWRPGRLTALSAGFTPDHTNTVAECLQARHFLVIDHETEEVLVRSWARYDELLKQPRMAVSYATAYAAVASSKLREVLAHETAKMRRMWPDLACWKDSRVAEILDHPAVSAKALPSPKDPFGDDFGDGVALGLPQTQPKVWASVSLPPTPSPATTTKPSVVEGGVGGSSDAPRKRAAQLPEDFEPNDTNRRVAEEHMVDLDRVLPQFRDHHIAKGTTMKDWHAALNTWVRRERPTEPAPQQRTLVHARDLERPPDGLSPAEFAEWDRARRERRRA